MLNGPQHLIALLCLENVYSFPFPRSLGHVFCLVIWLFKNESFNT